MFPTVAAGETSDTASAPELPVRKSNIGGVERRWPGLAKGNITSPPTTSAAFSFGTIVPFKRFDDNSLKNIYEILQLLLQTKITLTDFSRH